MDISGGGGGGGVSTVAVPLTDWLPSVAVTVYEPEASFPSVSVVLARPSLPVVALVGTQRHSPIVWTNAKRHCLPFRGSPILPYLNNKRQRITGIAGPGTTYHDYG